jgi:hypothetical protein
LYQRSTAGLSVKSGLKRSIVSRIPFSLNLENRKDSFRSLHWRDESRKGLSWHKGVTCSAMRLLSTFRKQPNRKKIELLKCPRLRFLWAPLRSIRIRQAEQFAGIYHERRFAPLTLQIPKNGNKMRQIVRT